MVVDRALVRKAGLPCSEYFIWFDDTEYSMRINRYTRFLVIPDAKLNLWQTDPGIRTAVTTGGNTTGSETEFCA
jgi:hypothetical protein